MPKGAKDHIYDLSDKKFSKVTYLCYFFRVWCKSTGKPLQSSRKTRFDCNFFSFLFTRPYLINKNKPSLKEQTFYFLPGLRREPRVPNFYHRYKPPRSARFKNFDPIGRAGRSREGEERAIYKGRLLGNGECQKRNSNSSVICRKSSTGLQILVIPSEFLSELCPIWRKGGFSIPNSCLIGRAASKFLLDSRKF